MYCYCSAMFQDGRNRPHPVASRLRAWRPATAIGWALVAAPVSRQAYTPPPIARRKTAKREVERKGKSSCKPIFDFYICLKRN